ncbi:hypothetical protein ACFOZ5_07415 [Marinobacter lacisalsi]|uniref:Uncharacterized protein n=1 Tax=Marinobacter lacisalsi TaxID=475979 RepID=A0ABV8QH39_9GAMM
MFLEGYAVSPKPLARAIRVGLLAGGAAGLAILAGCTGQGDRFVSADEANIGDAIKGELMSGSEINLKDGSRQGRHWVCGDGHEAGVLYRLNAPFLGDISLYDTEGNWLGNTHSTLESQASLLLSGGQACYLVVVSGSNLKDFGPYSLEPQTAPVAETLGDGVTVSGVVAEEEVVYPFTVDAPSSVSLRLSGGGRAGLSLRGEAESARPSLCGDDQQVMTAYLPAGEYEAVLTPGGQKKLPVDDQCDDTFASTGNGYRLSLDLSGLATGERNAGPLRSGDQITGTLAEPFATNEYTLAVEEPTRITLAVSSGEFDAVLTVRGGDTNIEVDDTDGNTDPRLDTLLMPGDYRIKVSGFEAEYGAYAIDVETTAFDGEFRNSGDLTSGEQLHGMADGVATNAYTLTLDQPTDVTIGLSSSVFDTLLTLQGEGVSLTDDDGGGGTDSRLNTVLGPGEYLVEVSSYAGPASGPFLLETSTSPYEGAIRQGCDEGQSGTCAIESDATVYDELSEDARQYEFVLEEPEQVVVSMSSTAFDTLLSLEGLGISLEDDDGGGQTNSRITTALQPGTYRITADSYEGTGPFTLRLESDPLQQ